MSQPIQRIRMKRPTIAKKPTPRRIEQSIFKTIVEMAYEMDYADKRDADVMKVKELLKDYLPRIKPTLRTGTLRKYLSRCDPDRYTKSITFRGRPLRFSIYMEYYRHRDDSHKWREEGTITVSPQKQCSGEWYDYRRIYSRRTYRTMNDFSVILPDLVYSILCIATFQL